MRTDKKKTTFVLHMMILCTLMYCLGGLLRFCARTYGYDSDCVFNAFFFSFGYPAWWRFVDMAYLCTAHLVSALYDEDE